MSHLRVSPLQRVGELRVAAGVRHRAGGTERAAAASPADCRAREAGVGCEAHGLLERQRPVCRGPGET